MGIAAYYRGNAVISRQLDEAAAANRLVSVDRYYLQAIEDQRDRNARRVASLGGKLIRAMRSIATLRATLTIERRRAALQLEALERTWDEARAAGLTADDPGCYWLALARHRAKRVDPSA